jgi:hypothetical protein
MEFIPVVREGETLGQGCLWAEKQTGRILGWYLIRHLVKMG